MSKTVFFATSNRGKTAWLQRVLEREGLTDWTVEQAKVDLVEIQSTEIAAISLSKARQAYEQLKKPVVVMDGGLYMHALNRFPGPYIRDMLDQITPETMAKMIGTFDDRRCVFENVVTYMDAPDSVHQFTDTTENVFTLTDQLWPHDHPEQLSYLWRLLVPSGLGYDLPLAALNGDVYNDFVEKRNRRDALHSALTQFALFLKDGKNG